MPGKRQSATVLHTSMLRLLEVFSNPASEDFLVGGLLFHIGLI
jgi:hypothetical protein